MLYNFGDPTAIPNHGQAAYFLKETFIFAVDIIRLMRQKTSNFKTHFLIKILTAFELKIFDKIVSLFYLSYS